MEDCGEIQSVPAQKTETMAGQLWGQVSGGERHWRTTPDRHRNEKILYYQVQT